MPQASFQERFAKLREDYADRLPGRVAVVERGLAAYLDHGDVRGLDEAYREVHALAGSAATFGMDEAGRRAEALKNALQSRREPRAELPPADNARLSELLLDLAGTAKAAKKI